MGLASGEEWVDLLLEFDETVPSDNGRWRWLPEIKAYLYTPTYLPPAWRYRQYVLAWDDLKGWVLSIPDEMVRVWFPLFDPNDGRNRPDQFALAALLVAEKYDNSSWKKVLAWLKKATKEKLQGDQ